MDPGSLRMIPMFAGMDEQDLRRIATFAATESAARRSLLVREGDFATELIATESGTADVTRGGARVGTLGRREVVAERRARDHQREAETAAGSDAR
jgi:hypothetical protein